MATTNDLTAIEGIDINNSYELKCIDRLNTKVNAINITGLTAQVATNTANIATNTTNIATNTTNIATNTANIATNTSSIGTINTTILTLTTTINNNKVDINVLDFGAKGNGVDDDTVAINAAIASLPNDNGILYFPDGIYKITTGTTTINNKTNLLIYGNGARIKCYFSGASTVSAFTFTNCSAVKFGDKILIECINGSLADSRGVSISAINDFNVNNLFISGDFKYGIYVFNNTNAALANQIINCGIKTCRVGIILDNETSGSGAEYIEIIGCKIGNCTDRGVIINAGNVSVTGCQINFNRIGLEVNGRRRSDNANYYNSDHGRLTGCTFNHNEAIGILFRAVWLGFQVSGCQIWANNGPANYTEAIDAGARGFHYGIYLEDSVRINITGCHIARNNSLSLATSGWAQCQVVGCHFQSDGSCLNHIWEFANTITNNTGYTYSRQNIITNNIFTGTITNSGADGRRYIRFSDDNDKPGGYVIRDNAGDTNDNGVTQGSTTNQIINSVDSYWLCHKEFTHIDLTAVGITNLSSSTPADQATNIYIPCQFIGSKFTIFIYNTANPFSRLLWIRIKTTTNQAPFITSPSITYSTTHKALKVSGNVYKIDFYPRANLGLEGWFIDGWNV